MDGNPLQAFLDERYQHDELLAPEAQLQIVTICRFFEQAPRLHVHENSVRCPLLDLQRRVQANGKPWPASSTETLDYLHQVSVRDPTLVGLDPTGRVTWLAVTVAMNAGSRSPPELLKNQSMWFDEALKWSHRLPVAPLRGWFTATGFTWMELINESLFGTGAVILNTFLFTGGTLLLLTGKGTVAGATLLGVGLILICFVGYLGNRGLPFGAVEGIGIGIFIGFSCDYCVHISKIFDEALGHAKSVPTIDIPISSVAEATCKHCGPSLYGAALTTCWACFPLLFCRMNVLSQFGELIIMVTFTSLLLSMTFLLPVFIIFSHGPCTMLARSVCRLARGVGRYWYRRCRRKHETTPLLQGGMDDGAEVDDTDRFCQRMRAGADANQLRRKILTMASTWEQDNKKNAREEKKTLVREQKSARREFLKANKKSSAADYDAAKKAMDAAAVRKARSSEARKRARAAARSRCVLQGSDFTSDELPTDVDQPVDAASAMAMAMGEDIHVLRTWLSQGLEAVVHEIETYGTSEQRGILHYVLHQSCGSDPITLYDSDGEGRVLSNRTRDDGTGWMLSDFAKHRCATRAKLTLAHVAALRFYSTGALGESFNGPEGQTGKLGLPVTRVLLNEALHMLAESARETDASDDGILSRPFEWDKFMVIGDVDAAVSDALPVSPVCVLARPPSSPTTPRSQRISRSVPLRLQEELLCRGAVALSPLLATRNLWSVLDSALHTQHPVLVRLSSVSGSQSACGVDISWCSVHPSVDEAVYPALTSLQPLGALHIAKDRHRIYLIDVHGKPQR